MFINERLKLALKSFMSKENITQKELALKFGITPMTVSRWMSGHTDRMAPDVWKRMRKQVEPFLPEEKLDERSDVLQIQVKSLDDVTGQSTKHSNIIIPKVETDISAFELTVYEGQISYRRLIIAKSTSEITENSFCASYLRSCTRDFRSGRKTDTSGE